MRHVAPLQSCQFGAIIRSNLTSEAPIGLSYASCTRRMRPRMPSLAHKVAKPKYLVLWGAALGTIPDLDVLIPLGDPVSNFTYHRSVSHSIFVLGLLTPLITWALSKIKLFRSISRLYLAYAVYACFVTHVLLDCFTVYGTQIFWPFDSTPASWSSLFIVDPLYTLATSPCLLSLFRKFPSISIEKIVNNCSRLKFRIHWMEPGCQKLGRISSEAKTCATKPFLRKSPEYTCTFQHSTLEVSRKI